MIIAVVDDTMQDRELLKGMLDQYFSGHQTVPEIQEFESGEAFLEAYEPGHYDIIFFDIYMGGITGMETASLVYERDKDCRLVFFSSSADYAVDSYRVRAAYYLMKPLSYEDLALALDCFTRELLEAGRGLTVMVKGGVEAVVPFSKLLYVDSLKRMVRIHTSDTVLEAAESFMAVTGRLMPVPLLQPGDLREYGLDSGGGRLCYSSEKWGNPACTGQRQGPGEKGIYGICPEGSAEVR
jgi:DNA-binding LytR/AlgR family response regulator